MRQTVLLALLKEFSPFLVLLLYVGNGQCIFSVAGYDYARKDGGINCFDHSFVASTNVS